MVISLIFLLHFSKFYTLKKMSQSNNQGVLIFNQKFFIPEILQNSQALLKNKKNIEKYSWEVEGESVI